MMPDHETLGRDGPGAAALPAEELVDGLFRAHAVTLVRVATLLLGV